MRSQPKIYDERVQWLCVHNDDAFMAFYAAMHAYGACSMRSHTDSLLYPLNASNSMKKLCNLFQILLKCPLKQYSPQLIACSINRSRTIINWDFFGFNSIKFISNFYELKKDVPEHNLVKFGKYWTIFSYILMRLEEKIRVNHVDSCDWNRLNYVF